MSLEGNLALVAHPTSEVLTDVYPAVSSLGYSVATRTSVVETLRFVARRSPEVVLCGDAMPSFEGEPLVGLIRRLAPRCRIVILTADGDGTRPDLETEPVRISESAVGDGRALARALPAAAGIVTASSR